MKTDVLIVGAGPTGLTLACELARRGIVIRVIEAQPGPQPGSRGKGLQPRSLEVFEDLGIIDRVLAHGQLAMPMESVAPDGQVTRGGAIPDSLRDRPDIPYAASLITPEWRVEEALRDRLSELGTSVQFGCALERFEQTDDQVIATLTNGETIAASWLVGCDGGHSVVRKQAGIAFVGETHDEVRMIVADVEVDGLDRQAWHLWRHAEGLVSLCPLPSTNLFQYQAGIAPGQRPELELSNLQAILEQRTGRTDIRLHTPSWSSLWRANIRLVERYRKARVLIAGDAAHIHTPAGGQGMNTGIQDAYNLGWKLASVIHGAAPSLLDTYEAERRPIAAHVLEMSTARFKETVQKNEISTRRDASTIQLDLHYRSSSLSRDDRDDTAVLRAGDRAPDATKLVTKDGERRLFDLLHGGRFTLLSFGPAFERSDVKTIRIGHDVVDSAGHLARAYGATDHTLVLVRPDGYIALVSDAGDGSAVTAYLADLAEPSSG